jgi:hypothetical protein
MQKRKFGVFLVSVLGLSVSLLAPLAQAVDTEGKILTLRGGGPVAGRLSILMAKATNVCSNPGWYAYDNGTSGTGRIWTDLLVAAYNTGKTIKIFGTGTCDPFGVEKIAGIDVK